MTDDPEVAARPAPRRPSTARPRQDVEQDEGMAPPSARELEAIEQSQIDWMRLLGADVVEDDALGAVLIHHSDPVPGFNATVRVRWTAADAPARLAELERRVRENGLWP